MTIEQYMADVARTMRPDDHITDGALGLTSEAGEVADLIMKARWGQRLYPEKVAEELGDVLFYLTQIADGIGYTLEQVMEINVAKRKKRYPNGWSLTGSYHD